MILSVFADDTGIHNKAGTEDGSEVAGAAGFAGLVGTWGKFSEEWQMVLNEESLESFHMSAMRNTHTKPGSPYFSWSTEKQFAYALRLAKIIGKHIEFGIAGMFHVRQYENDFPPEFKQKLLSPYRIAFLLFFEQLIKEAKLYFQFANLQVTRMPLVFDHVSNSHHRQYLHDAYRRACTGRDAANLLGDMVIVNPNQKHTASNLPLQAADLFAYVARRHVAYPSKQGIWKRLERAMGKPGKLQVISYGMSDLFECVRVNESYWATPNE